jgi:ABC-type Fe3+/spermidine/putrescine transport system ATPase subunit
VATTLQLNNISKTFDATSTVGAHKAVDDVSLQVPAGKFAALLGTSGSGKTTLLRIVAGLLAPDHGEVMFDGIPVTHVQPERRNIGMVFQHHRLFPHMTVEKNITFGLRMRGVSKHEQKKRVIDVLEMVQLEGFETRFPRSLSGGQQQRIALARTIVTRPKVLLMDEPFSSLDAQLRDDLRDVVANLQAQLGMTTVFVTHDQREALQLADVVAVLDKGRLEQVASPPELYTQPASRTVANFMSVRNFMTGRLEQDKFITSLGKLKLCRPPQTISDEVTVIIRPEQIVMHHQYLDNLPNLIQGQITQVRYQGGVSRYLVSVGQDERLDVQGNYSDVAVGSQVWLELPPKYLWCLPKGV